MTVARPRHRQGRSAGTLALVGLVLGVLVVFGCRREEPAPEPVIRPVRYERVESAAGPRERLFSGVAVASTEWTGSFKVPGTVIELDVEVGDRVEADELLAALDPYDYELQVQQALAGLRQAEAAARNAAANFERVRELWENNNVSLAEYDSARAADESARQAVVSADKALELARQRLEYTRLEAPVGGDVAEVRVEENENINTGQPVVVMTSGARPEVSVAIPETLITQVRQGDPVSVTFDALAGRELPATVTEVGVSTVGMATTFPVTVRLDEIAPEVRSGMAAEVRFTFGTAARPILVPAAAVVEDRQGRFVFRLEAAGEGLGVARRTPVTVGEIRGDQAGGEARMEVLSGLSDGDLVVTAGAKRIIDGQQVRISGDSG